MNMIKKNEQLKTSMIKLFFSFLKDNNAYEKWRRNVDKDRICDIMNRNYYDLYIKLSFFWAGTKEGHMYWRNLDDKWEKIVKFVLVNNG